MKRISFILGLLLLLTACRAAYIPATPTVWPSMPAAPGPTETTFPTSIPATPLPSFTATTDPYYFYTIDYLLARSYGGGQIDFYEEVGKNNLFTRYFFRYPSDGLNIYGFANIPNAENPHAVIIALHGYLDPAAYNTFDYTSHYADALADAGYLVLHPNLLGYQPSDDGDNLFRVGMATDVLNLIALVQTQSGGADPLRNADPNRIGLWGHSMGGGITTRVLTVSHAVKAAVLYAAMSGDEQKNYEAIRGWSGNTRGLDEANIPNEALNRISPMYFFENITAAISIHHGLADQLVPVEWSQLTCDQLTVLGKNVACHYYENMPHTFTGTGDEQFIQSTLQFFDEYLKAP